MSPARYMDDGRTHISYAHTCGLTDLLIQSWFESNTLEPLEAILALIRARQPGLGVTVKRGDGQLPLFTWSRLVITADWELVDVSSLFDLCG
jgi:hypothetical protein